MPYLELLFQGQTNIAKSNVPFSDMLSLGEKRSRC